MRALDCDCIENPMGRFEEERKVERIQNAINHIKTATDVDPWAVEIAVEAMDMAIEALKYSEIPNSSDTISRQAAIDVEDDKWN